MNILRFFPTIFLMLNIFSISAKQSMKILMVVSTFPKIHDICILNQITGLIDRGHDVYICSFHRGDCDNVQKNVFKYNLLKRTIFDRLPTNLNEYDIVMFQLGHKISNIRNTHNYNGKIVVCMRGYDITGYLQMNPYAYDRYFEICDLFLPVCEAFKKILENIGCDPKKIIVHHSAIDCSQFKFNPKRRIKKDTIKMISSGRFVEKKGFIYAIYAIANLIKKYPGIEYTIIGDGPLKKEYIKFIQQLGIGDKIKLDGWHTHEEYINILNDSDIFVLPSVTAKNNDQEGIPNVLKEAMAVGLPVIATNHSGNGELIINKVSGLLVPERDSRAIYKAIKFIINNYKKVSRMQQKAVKRVHTYFEIEKSNDELESILLNLLNEQLGK